MTKPNFLGIGAMRSGTSWLYGVLRSHPDVYLPFEVKEIHFFDNNYHKGIGWYLSFFDKAKDGYKAIGEITPRYMYDKYIPPLVKKHFPDMKFIVILRDPVKRLYSNYKLSYMKGNTKAKNIYEFMKENNESLERGYYAKQLKNWFNHFPKDNFLVLIFEEVVADKKKLYDKLGSFLGVDSEKFSPSEKTHPSYVPRLSFLYRFGIRFNKFLLRIGLYKISSLFIDMGSFFFRKLGSKKHFRKLSSKEMSDFYKYYKEDIEELEKLLGKDLFMWKH